MMTMLETLAKKIKPKKTPKLGSYEKVYDLLKSNAFFKCIENVVCISIEKQSDGNYTYIISIKHNPDFPDEIELNDVPQNWLEFYLDDFGYVPSSINEFIYLFTGAIRNFDNNEESIKHVTDLCNFAISSIVKSKVVIINVKGKGEFILGRVNNSEGLNKFFSAETLHVIKTIYPDMSNDDRVTMCTTITANNYRYLTYVN